MNINRTFLGPLNGTQSSFGTSVLSTTPVKVDLPSVGVNTISRFYHVIITNDNAANVIAFQMVPAGAAAPVFTANMALSTCGHPITKLSRYEFTTLANVDLYVVASAGSTTCQVTVYVQ